MATFDNDLLSEEDVDNINNDNEGDDHVGESSSDNGEIEMEMKRILKIGKKVADEVNGRTNIWITL